MLSLIEDVGVVMIPYCIHSLQYLKQFKAIELGEGTRL